MYLSELFQIDDECEDWSRQRHFRRSLGIQQQTRTGAPTNRTRSHTPSSIPSITLSPDRRRRFRLPAVTTRRGTPLSRTPQERPSGKTSGAPSRDRHEAPSYEGVSRRPEANPSDTGAPPPSYEEVMGGNFTEIRIDVRDECADRRDENPRDHIE